MANPEIVAKLGEPVEAWNAWRVKSHRPLDLSGADLRNMRLGEGRSGAFLDLQGAQLDHADLTGATLSFVDLAGANLKGAQLTDARVELANLGSCDLSGAHLLRSRI